MTSRDNRTETTRVFALASIVVLAGSFSVAQRSIAEERKFVVMLAHSPKSFVVAGRPGLPPGGLADVNAINKEYFDDNPLNNVDSFKEFWNEISYGDVTVTGTTFGWITVPWAFDPVRASPANFINLRTGNMISEGSPIPLPTRFSYGAGEDYCDSFSSQDITPPVNTDECGELIITDNFGRPPNNFAPRRAAGLADSTVAGINVWTPGERFLDIDGDDRWDGLDEINDMMCHGPNGCTDICAPSVCSISGRFCDTSPGTVFARTCPSGETCVVATGICTVTAASPASCESNAVCPAGQSCGPGGVCRSATGGFCATNAHCRAGEFCVGTCRVSLFTDITPSLQLCENRDDCPNALEVCVGSGSELPCGGVVLGCPSGETCGDPRGSGPRGCNEQGCGDLAWPWFNFNGNEAADNPTGDVRSTQSGCTILERIPCLNAGVCDPGGHLQGHPTLVRTCVLVPGHASGLCEPTNCIPDFGASNVELPPCCDDADPNVRVDCVTDGGIDIVANPAAEGITCGTPIFCCEFVDADQISGLPGDGNLDVVEPFEDFMIRWNPAGRTPGTVWVRVDEQYVRDNYPGDVEALVRRTGNGYYDSPDLFIDRGSTKMMQDAGQNQFAWKTPKPGQRKLGSPRPAPGSAYLDEASWFNQWWTDRYGSASTPPPWPGGGGPSPPFNSPRMRPFNPNAPVPAAAEPTAARRWFHPNHGGASGFGRHPNEDNHWASTTPFVDLDLGAENPLWPILPEETFGYYDGWVEHDDLPSSKYHREGDKRLGEVTSPGTDTVTLPDVGTGTVSYTAIFGADLGEHNSNLPFADPDEFNVAAGPYAVEIHGEKGFDAGDVCILEWLTWRRDGKNSTIAYQWEEDNGPYHPFAGPSSQLTNGPVGFRDYNLDGMVDQGEVRPELSENYSVDSDPETENDGTHSNYPFNRERLAEDVIEALDPSIDWDEFKDANSMRASLCRRGVLSASSRFFDPAHPGNPDHNKTIDSEGFVSGIILAPPGAYGNVNLFPHDPLDFPYFPIHNEDNDNPSFDFPSDAAIHQSFNVHFHDLVVCQDCRPLSTSAKQFAAHQYGHSWEGWPDLFDFDALRDVGDVENCPVGVWDLMAGVSGSGGFVHPSPILKEQSCTAWTDPIDLKSVLIPGVEATITLPPAELVRDQSYFFLENDDRPGEKYYFWSAGSGFDQGRVPAPGMLIMHTDTGPRCNSDTDCTPPAQCVDGICIGAGSNTEGLPLQQNTPPWGYQIVQADGRGDLEACASIGNRGDDGDVWPGSSNATVFNRTTDPPATWNTLNRWTGLDISNVEPDGNGSVRMTLTWVPTNIPSLRFLDPPGGESVPIGNESIYQIRFEATDVFGGTQIRLFYTEDKKTCEGLPGGTPCNESGDCADGEACRNNTTIGSSGVHEITNPASPIRKSSSGTSELSFDWDIRNPRVSDGRYVLFAKLIPGAGNDGREREATQPRAAPSNGGDGTLTVTRVDIDGNRARSETWTVRCIDPDGEKWLVSSSLSQPEPVAGAGPDPSSALCTDELIACTDTPYTSEGGEVQFIIAAGATSFTLDDSFIFTTTGVTAVSQGVTITDGRITLGPVARICGSRFQGDPPLAVTFRATGDVGCPASSDPNGEPLIFLWDFGDGSPNVAGSVVAHTYVDAGIFTVVLKATNPSTRRFDETSATVHVTNNSPTAQIIAVPTSGIAPLEVRFDGSGSSDSETAAEDLIYQWDFGDGSSANDQAVPGIRINTEHVYTTRENGSPCTANDVCTFNPTLTVTDTGGLSHTTTTKIVVGNTRPKCVIAVSPTGGPNPLTVTFDASASTDDDAGDVLTICFDFDDPSSIEPTGTVVLDGTGNGTIPHVYQLGDDDPSPADFNPTAKISDRRVASCDDASIEFIPCFVDNVSVRLNENAVAEFDVIPARGVTGLPITFDASRSSDPDGEIVSYVWNFGDGSPVARGVLVTHIYTEMEDGTACTLANPCIFTVKLTVTDDRGKDVEASKTITVDPPEGNQNPVAHIATGPRTGTAPLTLTFDGSNSFDPDIGDVLQYSWSFTFAPDETTTPRPDDTLAGPVVTKTFANPGFYTVALTVDDRRGGVVTTDPEEIRVTEAGQLPTDEPGGTQPLPGADEPPDSALQRPNGGICGLGMVMSLFGSLLGLSAMMATRGRFRTVR